LTRRNTGRQADREEKEAHTCDIEHFQEAKHIIAPLKMGVWKALW